MNTQIERFPADGYVVVDDFLTAAELEHLHETLATSISIPDGDRRLLDRDWCRVLAHVIRHRLLKRRLLHLATQPVLCVYACGADDPYCAADLHRDLYVPLAARCESTHFCDWSEKQGIAYARAPSGVLESMVAVRLYLDPGEPGGAILSVVPGSHLTADVNAARVECSAPAGGAVVLRPLLLHAAPLAASGSPQRVLHFLFGSKALPDKASWYYRD